MVAIDEHTLHFVGGRGDGSGAPAAGGTGGGCTRAEWESSSGINETLSNIMGTTGEPICDGTTADATIGGLIPGTATTGVRLTQSAGDSFTTNGALVGTIVYVNFAATYADGYYIIYAVGSVGDDIDINIVFTGNQAGNTCYVGGAHADLQDAMDEIANATAATGSRWIYSNLGETLAAALDVSVINGDKDEDAHVWIIAYGTTPNDYNVGTDGDGSYVDIDGDNGAYAVFDLNLNENIHIWNFYAHNVNTAANDCIEITTCLGVDVNNCKLDDARYGVVADTAEYGIIVRNCTFETALTYNAIRMVDSYGTIINNLIKDTGDTRVLTNIGAGVVSGNIIIGGAAGCNLGGITRLVTVNNNTFYNQATAGVRVYDAMVQIYNNIFYFASAADFAVWVNSSATGSVECLSYNCAYRDGGVLTNAFYHNGKSEDLWDDGTNVYDDPEFIDPTTFDFTPENWQMMEGGPADVSGNPTHIGAVGKPSAYDIIVAEGL